MRALVVLVMLAGVAAAQPSDPAVKARSDAAYAEGSSAYDANDFTRAAARFEEAYAIVPDPAFLFNIGQAYRQAKDCAKAQVAFARYIELVPGAPNIDNAKSLLDETTVCATFAEGRRLLGMGKPAEACAKFVLAYQADPGAVGTLLNLGLCSEQMGKLATAAGWFRRAHQQAAAAGVGEGVEQAKQHLDAMATKIPRIEIVAAPSARVKLDGVVTAARSFEVDPGRHTVEVDRSSRTVELAIGQHETVTIIERAGAPSNRLAYIVGAAGLSLWTGTVVLGFVGKSKYDDATSLDEKREWKDVVRYGGTSMFVVGTAAVATSVVLYIRNRGRRTETTAVAPAIGSHQVGLSLTGAF